MLQEPRLTATSFIVLGLVEQAGRATPYDLKALVGQTVGEFWSLPHAQLYAEPDRLTRAGYLREEREESGRRRKHYEITEKGSAALREWRDEPTTELTELRDPGLLRLFFGADPARLAEGQLAAHERKLAGYEALRAAVPPDAPRGIALTVDAGVAHEREWVRFWRAVAAEEG